LRERSRCGSAEQTADAYTAPKQEFGRVKMRKPKRPTKEQKGDRAGEVVTIEELSRYLHVPESTLYRWVRMGQLPGSKVDGRWRLELLRVQDRLVDTYELKMGGQKKQ
jgi:excisionase family DNA binding protein